MSHFYETTIAGIPCLIEITYYNYTPGSGCYATAETPEDLFGTTELEYIIQDREGYAAPWLEEKLTPDTRAALREDIIFFCQDNNI